MDFFFVGALKSGPQDGAWDHFSKKAHFSSQKKEGFLFRSAGGLGVQVDSCLGLP